MYEDTLVVQYPERCFDLLCSAMCTNVSRAVVVLSTCTPAAASLQEAALYLPYPAELLGFSSFGVQLDVRGRLVFRGPRFKMGLNEGTPTCILPDHLGR